jgi:hypothetical protein
VNGAPLRVANLLVADLSEIAVVGDCVVSGVMRRDARRL